MVVSQKISGFLKGGALYFCIISIFFVWNRFVTSRKSAHAGIDSIIKTNLHLRNKYFPRPSCEEAQRGRGYFVSDFVEEPRDIRETDMFCLL